MDFEISSTRWTGFLLRSAYERIESGEQKNTSIPYFFTASIAMGKAFLVHSVDTYPMTESIVKKVPLFPSTFLTFLKFSLTSLSS